MWCCACVDPCVDQLLLCATVRTQRPSVRKQGGVGTNQESNFAIVDWPDLVSACSTHTWSDLLLVFVIVSSRLLVIPEQVLLLDELRRCMIVRLLCAHFFLHNATLSISNKARRVHCRWEKTKKSIFKVHARPLLAQSLPYTDGNDWGDGDELSSLTAGEFVSQWKQFNWLLLVLLLRISFIRMFFKCLGAGLLVLHRIFRIFREFCLVFPSG